MANIKVAGNAVIVTSSLKYEDLKKIARYQPEELFLREWDDDNGVNVPIFRIIPSDGKAGYLDSNGAVFGRANSDGFATATMVFDPGESEDIRSAVLDRYGPGILHLEQIERQLGDKLLSLNSRLDDAAQSITVIE